MEDKEKGIECKLKEKTEELMEFYVKEGLDVSNIDFVSKITDIHKDMSNEEYWKEKINMMYKNYSEGSFGRRGVPGTGRRSYREGGYSEGGYSYGRRGVPGSGRRSYRGEEALEDMQYHYGNYSEGATYGHDIDSEKSFHKMMECLETFLYTIMDEADEPMKKDKIKKVIMKALDE